MNRYLRNGRRRVRYVDEKTDIFEREIYAKMNEIKVVGNTIIVKKIKSQK